MSLNNEDELLESCYSCGFLPIGRFWTWGLLSPTPKFLLKVPLNLLTSLQGQSA